MTDDCSRREHNPPIRVYAFREGTITPHQIDYAQCAGDYHKSHLFRDALYAFFRDAFEGAKK